MKWKTYLVVLFFVASGFFVTGWTAYSQDPNSSKPLWEYKLVISGHTEHKEGIDFDKLGAQGWELVAVDRPLQNGTSYHATYYFKRAK